MNINDYTRTATQQIISTIGDSLDDSELTGIFTFNVGNSTIRNDNDELIITDSKTGQVWLVKVTEKN